MLPSLMGRSDVFEPRPMMNWSLSMAMRWLLNIRYSVGPGPGPSLRLGLLTGRATGRGCVLRWMAPPGGVVGTWMGGGGMLAGRAAAGVGGGLDDGCAG